MKNLKLWGNGETHYELSPNGAVKQISNYPNAKPGKDFLKNVHDEKNIGTIGEEGYAYVCTKIDANAYKNHEGYDGCGCFLYPFFNEVETRVSPGLKRRTI